MDSDICSCIVRTTDFFLVGVISLVYLVTAASKMNYKTLVGIKLKIIFCVLLMSFLVNFEAGIF